MHREKIKDASTGVSFEKIIHPTGLTIYLYENHEYTGCYALYGTNFGSYDRTFQVGNDTITVPDGIAHFLEHKLFESEEQDAFQRFAKTGASANAYTSFDKTCYLFSASQNVMESLEILLDFVNHPYFTEKSVAKEQGIIGQEITMYDDNPGWQVMFSALGALFVNSSVKADIAGTVQTIAKITPELLYQCYNTFYCPKNMVLSVAGNFDTEELLGLVDRIVEPGKVDFSSVWRVEEEEPDEILSQRVHKKMAVSLPMFSIAYKEIPDPEEERERGIVEGELLQCILFGDSSDLYCDMYDKGLINSAFGTEVFAGQRGREYYVHILEGESLHAEKVCKNVTEYLREKKQVGITQKELDRAKKVLYGDYIKSYNSLEAVATRMLTAHFGDDILFDRAKYLKDVSLQSINRRFKKQFREDRMVFTLIDPKE